MNAAVEGLLVRWGRGIPVNVNLSLAIEAHKIALGNPEYEANALRIVCLAALPTAEDAKRQLEYLEAVPLAAWHDWVGHSAEEIRSETLANCRLALCRRRAYETDCVRNN